MCRNPFKREEAEPLRDRRILRPPILRRISGGNADRYPLDCPPDNWRHCRNPFAGSSGEIDGQSPGNCRETDRTLPGIHPENIPEISAALSAVNHRHHRRSCRAIARLIPVL